MWTIPANELKMKTFRDTVKELKKTNRIRCRCRDRPSVCTAKLQGDRLVDISVSGPQGLAADLRGGVGGRA
jgi:hypothetical protein